MMRLTEPELQGFSAAAMATHGSADALHALLELARLGSGSDVRRSAALDGLGMMLSPHEPMELLHVARGANYTVFADWVDGIFQTTL
jgi:hypothetical protein